MQDSSKTKQELIEELSILNQRIQVQEKLESERNPAKEALQESGRHINE